MNNLMGSYDQKWFSLIFAEILLNAGILAMRETRQKKYRITEEGRVCPCKPCKYQVEGAANELSVVKCSCGGRSLPTALSFLRILILWPA